MHDSGFKRGDIAALREVVGDSSPGFRGERRGPGSSAIELSKRRSQIAPLSPSPPSDGGVGRGRGGPFSVIARFAFCICLVALSVLLCLIAPSVLAHDSPEHVIELLSARMQERGKTAELLWRRATEHRALGQLAAAAADLREAVAMKPGFLQAQADLGRVDFHRGKMASAIETLDHAIASTADAASRGPLHLVRAEVRSARGDWTGALADAEQAISACSQPEPEPYLLRGQIQLRLGQAAAAAAGLKQGFDRTGSVVLEAEWIDALLDAGQPRAALDRIEPQLAESRLQSSWLLRRARARLALGDTLPARGDLHAAISEVDERLSAAHPDPALLLDRGLALALLGDVSAASRDLAVARKAGAEDSASWRLETLLAAAKSGGRAR